MSYFRSKPSAGPQTWLEQRQQRQVLPENCQIRVSPDVEFDMLHIAPGERYRVYHLWCKAIPTSDHYVRFWPHHSQIFIVDVNTNLEVTNFGVAPVEGHATLVWDKVASQRLKTGEKTVNAYILSQSYTPNPVKVYGRTIHKAFKAARGLTGDKYHLLLNNCQKFARIFMQECGSMHRRHPTHP